jgi:hypothetical protein
LGAVIEGDGPGAFLTEHPDLTYERGQMAKVPWISSRAEHEIDMGVFTGERERITGKRMRGSHNANFSTSIHPIFSN